MPPPTLNNNANSVALGPNDEDDGQYREDPSIYWKDPKYNKGFKYSPKPAAAPAPVNYNYNSEPNQYYKNNVASQPAQEPINYNYNSEPNQYYQNNVAPQPTYRQPAVYQPLYNQPAQQPYYQRRSEPVYSHPAIQAFDINSGSYTINYSG